MIGSFLTGRSINNIDISTDNKLVAFSIDDRFNVLTKKNKNVWQSLDSNIVTIKFLTPTRIIIVTENGQVCDYEIKDESLELKNSRQVTAFPVMSAFVENYNEENGDYDLWIVIKKNVSKKYVQEVCFTRVKSSLETITTVPINVKKEQIIIKNNVISYCTDYTVRAILLDNERKIVKETEFTKKKQSYDNRFVRIASNGSYLAVVLIDGCVYKWSNLLTNGVSDTYHSLHWHKIAPHVAVSSYGNVLSAGAECTVARFTKGQKKPTLLPRLIAPVVQVCLSKDCSTLVLLMENNTIHTVLLATMAIETSFSTINYCQRSLNTIFSRDPLANKCIVINAKPGDIQWIDPLRKRTIRTKNITMENVVDGDMSLVGIKQVYRDVLAMECGLGCFATIEKYINFDSNNHLRLWKRSTTEEPYVGTIVSTVEVDKDVVMIATCGAESAEFEKTIITASTSGTISVWEFSENYMKANEDLARRSNWMDAPINAITSIQADGRFVSGHGEHIVLWNVANMKVVDVLSAGAQIERLQFVDKYVIIGTEASVMCLDTRTMMLTWRVDQHAGITVSDDCLYVFDGKQVMKVGVDSGKVEETVTFNVDVEDLIVLKRSLVAKTSQGILSMSRNNPEEETSNRTRRESIRETISKKEMPFKQLAKNKDSMTNEDTIFVEQPKPDADKLFAGPVQSLPPISYLAPMFIEKSLLPPRVMKMVN